MTVPRGVHVLAQETSRSGPWSCTTTIWRLEDGLLAAAVDIERDGCSVATLQTGAWQGPVELLHALETLPTERAAPGMPFSLAGASLAGAWVKVETGGWERRV